MSRSLARMGSCRSERRSPLRSDGRERPTRFGLSGRSGVTPSADSAATPATPQSRAGAPGVEQPDLLGWHVSDKVARRDVDFLLVGQRIGRFGLGRLDSVLWGHRNGMRAHEGVANVPCQQVEAEYTARASVGGRCAILVGAA